MERTYSVGDLMAAFPPIASTPRSRRPAVQITAYALLTADDLHPPAGARLRDLIDNPPGVDRSDDVFACAAEMQRSGYTHDAMMGILMNPANAIHGHIGEAANPERAARRAVEAAYARHSAAAVFAAPFTVIPPGMQPLSYPPTAPVDVSVIAATPYSWPNPSTIPRRQWLFGRWLLRGEVTVVLAPGGVGKSTLAATMAVSLASGRDLLGQAPRERVGAWIYNLEDAPDELHRQVAAACLRHGVQRDECAGRLFVNSGITMPLCTATESRAGFIIDEQAFAQLTETIRAQRIGAVIVDPLVSSHRVTEASNEAMDALIKRWKRLAHETGCAVTLVHHTRKLAGREVTAEDGRGASALRDAARVVLVLNGMDKEYAAKLGLTEEERRSLVRVDMGKASRSPAEEAIWIKLESQSLGNENGPEPADYLGVAVPWQLPAAPSQLLALPIAALQAGLGERDWRKDPQAADWVGHLIADVAGLNAVENEAHIKVLQGELIKQGWFAVETRKIKGKQCPCIAIGRPFTTSHPENEGGGEGGETDAA